MILAVYSLPDPVTAGVATTTPVAAFLTVTAPVGFTTSLENVSLIVSSPSAAMVTVG